MFRELNSFKRILIVLLLAATLVGITVGGVALASNDEQITTQARQVTFFAPTSVATSTNSSSRNMRDYSNLDIYYDVIFTGVVSPAQAVTLKLQHRCGSAGNWADGVIFASALATSTVAISVSQANPCENTRVAATLSTTDPMTITVRGLGK